MLHLAQVVKAAVAGEMWPQAELPRQVADSRQRLWQPGWQGRPKQSNGSAGGPQKSQNTADSRRLSRAIGSEVAHDFTWIPGPDSNLYSCNCYLNQYGEPLATFVSRKVRQWPPHVGKSSFGVECRSDDVLLETLSLLRGVGYRGLGYVEFKLDERNGKKFIVEPNVGRPTGRSAIAEAGGVELLHTMYCDLLGLPLPDNREQRYGSAIWMHERRDLQSAFYYWRAGELTLRDWARSWSGGPKALALFSIRDPGPFVSDSWRVARKLLSARSRWAKIVGNDQPVAESDATRKRSMTGTT